MSEGIRCYNGHASTRLRLRSLGWCVCGVLGWVWPDVHDADMGMQLDGMSCEVRSCVAWVGICGRGEGCRATRGYDCWIEGLNGTGQAQVEALI